MDWGIDFNPPSSPVFIRAEGYEQIVSWPCMRKIQDWRRSYQWDHHNGLSWVFHRFDDWPQKIRYHKNASVRHTVELELDSGSLGFRSLALGFVSKIYIYEYMYGILLLHVVCTAVNSCPFWLLQNKYILAFTTRKVFSHIDGLGRLDGDFLVILLLPSMITNFMIVAFTE